MSRWAFIFIALLVSPLARGQSDFTGPNAVHSVSGQFTVLCQTDEAPAARRFNPGTNEVIRLEPAFLAVSAERFKMSVWHRLGLKPDSPWRGKIYLSLRPARSLEDGVTLTASPFLQVWNYRVELPDALTHTRYARALAAVVLLEIANRTAAGDGRSADVPAWLADGTARQTLATDGDQFLLSTPIRGRDALPITRLNQTARGLDALAEARRLLANTPALTFDQLSWPTDAQVAGTDGGVYFASAQLFLTELLQLKNGGARLRDMLARLPACQNWQTAFFQAFREDFRRPLDVEKWWALRVVAFAAHAPGPTWTASVSRDRLAELVSVPLEFRRNSNALPAHMEVSLQTALRSLEPAQRTAVMQTKLRDLELAQLRVAPAYAALTDGYRQALADLLGERTKAPATTVATKHAATARGPASVAETLKKLDALDVRRRGLDAQVNSFQKQLRPGGP